MMIRPNNHLCRLVVAFSATLCCDLQLTASALDASDVTTPLSDLAPLSASQGWGQLATNRSVWGKPLQIGERRFAHGLGTHAASELVYELAPGSERFEAWVGVDAAMRQYEGASVVFKVLADGRELFDSGVMKAGTPAKRVSVAVAGADELTLVVTDAGDGGKCDHADWAEAVLIGRPKPVAAIPAPRPAKFRVQSADLTLELSDQGELVGAAIGPRRFHRAVRGGTALARCTNHGTVASRELDGGGIEFKRAVVHAQSNQRATVTERFLPAKESVRWEIEITGEDAPWTTGIETHLKWPNDTARFWTAWNDPQQQVAEWRDPLVFRPFVTSRLWYGTPRWDEARPRPSFAPEGHGRCFVIPLLTLAEPECDLGFSLVLSPEDPLLEMSLTARKEGGFTFRRNDHRISRTNVVRFAMDLVAHEADWRAGLGWMTRRYADCFNPPNPRAHDVAGLGAYSFWEGELDAAKLKRMGFGVNWKASYDFPYMGMFLATTEQDDERYPRFLKGGQTSVTQMRDYSRRMRALGFRVLNYFNVTEFGGLTGNPRAAAPALAPKDRWKNLHNFMRDEIPDAVLLDLEGRTFLTWEDSVATDPGDPKYRAFLLGQARRHIEKLPDSDGICIDRLDWLRFYNFRADDGQSWRRNQPCRSLYSSWRALMAEMGPLFHAGDKVVFVNALVNRLDLFRQVDGIYHEYGDYPADLNGTALQCLRKPGMVWTRNENTLKPDPDVYFQRNLYLGLYPTAPLPDNCHTILPSAWADRWYLDYGRLFDTLHGRRWVLAPHVISVDGSVAKANLFEVPGGYLAAVAFGGKAASATVRLRNVTGLDKVECHALHPGTEATVPVPARFHDGQLELQVPLTRGCAMVRLSASNP